MHALKLLILILIYLNIFCGPEEIKLQIYSKAHKNKKNVKKHWNCIIMFFNFSDIFDDHLKRNNNEGENHFQKQTAASTVLI